MDFQAEVPSTSNSHRLTSLQNRAQSGDFDRILQLQGVGWLSRQALRVSSITVTITIKQYDDEEGLNHLDAEQQLSGGIKSTPEPRTIDWKVRTNHDATLGDVLGRTRVVESKNLEAEFGKDDVAFLGEGWDSQEQIQSFLKNEKKGWTTNQIWGFQSIEGARKHVRKVVVRKGTDVAQAVLIYDWLGGL